MKILMRGYYRDGSEILGTIDNFVVSCKFIGGNSFYKTSMFKAAMKHLENNHHIKHYRLFDFDTNKDLYIQISRDYFV